MLDALVRRVKPGIKRAREQATGGGRNSDSAAQ